MIYLLIEIVLNVLKIKIKVYNKNSLIRFFHLTRLLFIYFLYNF